MNYHELIQAYFERSVALQWYWTVYVLVIGGVLGFSTFRQRPELVTTILVTVLYLGFAYKNLGAIRDVTELRRDGPDRSESRPGPCRSDTARSGSP